VKNTIPAKVVGLEVGAVSQTLDARWLMAYAAGLGETDPRFYDTQGPNGPLAHPMFAACYEWTVALTLRSKTLRPELLPLGVHTSHHLVIHRRPQASDRLLTRGQVITLAPVRSGALVVTRYSTVDRNGRPVTTTDYGSIFRGVTCEGETSAAVPPLACPTLPAGDQVRWSSAVPISAQADAISSPSFSTRRTGASLSICSVAALSELAQLLKRISRSIATFRACLRMPLAMPIFFQNPPTPHRIATLTRRAPPLFRARLRCDKLI